MEGDAGTGSVNQVEDSVDAESGTEQTSMPNAAADAPAGMQRGPSRVGRRWTIALCIVLVALAAGAGIGGYFGLRGHRESEAIARNNAEAIAAAKECVLATQAPDSEDVVAAEEKILQCSAGEFRTQALVYSQMFVEAYRAAEVKVQVLEMRAAVERTNDDGSRDVLVAFRVKVDNIEAEGREFGYRLRAQMAPENGRYRIAKLDQVAR